ncbi:MAG: methionine synthase [Acidimicrobiales bacterium]
MVDFLGLVERGVVIFDGATGTHMQGHNLGPDDFGGAAYEGCNEILVVTRPELVSDMHRQYFVAGADVAETNTFGGFSVPLGEYNLAHRCYELNATAAQLARAVADQFTAADPTRPRFVAGSMGPGTKFASLGQITYAELRDAYQEQARGLLDGGVDLLMVETQFDLLGIKAAMAGCRRAMADVGREVPIQTQVTIEVTGRMLPGTEIGAALSAIDPLHPDIIGINCATGPAEMWEHLRYLCEHARMPVSCLPNAGLPSVVDGHMHYDLTAQELADYHRRFVSDLGVRVIGGCCGTTPEYIELLDRTCRVTPAPRNPVHEPSAASMYSNVTLKQDTSFLIIGERTNANGSKKFRDLMLEGDWDGCVQMARDQIKEGAHLLDVCVDYVGRAGAADMDELIRRLCTQSSVPLTLDSTEPEVMEAGLAWIGGRALLNSGNLEDGDGPGSRADRVFALAKEYGAAVICLLIDEEGQARDVEWKMRVAHRIHDLATKRYGLESSDLIFDALTFPLSTGDNDLRRDAMATIEAIGRIKTELPGTFTTLGVSNVSFGLNPAARHVLNSVFLAECVKAGLDSAIVHAGKIMPLNRIPDEQRQVCLDLIYDRRDAATGYDPLQKLLEVFADVTVAKAAKVDRTGWSVEQRLTQRVIDGERDGLEADLDEAMTNGRAPLDIINDPLLAGMKVVGELFATGEMQLPFVLQSAETMKTAVAYLERFMEATADGSSTKGSIVLATVKGDVHDIGKNLVDIILTNNGYRVHNLGIKVPVADMIDAVVQHSADAIGMSGLLVKSTLIMRDNLEELNARGLSHVPVLLGGAALTRSYVERDLREVYTGRLFYGKDAFEGLRVMDRLGELRRSGEDDADFGHIPTGRGLPERSRLRTDAAGAGADVPRRSPEVDPDNTLFTPPFVGSRVVKGVPLDEISTYINETALFRNQWQFRPITAADGAGHEALETDADFKDRVRPLFREQLAMAKQLDLLLPQVVYGYFPANADGNELIIWEDAIGGKERMRFTYPRQREHPYLCISDFFRPVESGVVDHAAFHIVTMGARISEETAALFSENRYQHYLLLHGLGVEMTEALAEYWHRRIRQEWGFAGEDGDSLVGLFRQVFRGGRYSWGYPACPDLEDNTKVAELLGADRLGIEVSEETGWQFQPEQTTSAIICHHPQAKYFVARS